MLKKAVATLGAVLALLGAARAAPPPGADPALHDWFQDLKRPADGGSCCSLADCHTLTDGQWREIDNGYQILIRGQWVTVPPADVLPHKNNPTGGAVACYDEVRRVIYCFVRSPET